MSRTTQRQGSKARWKIKDRAHREQERSRRRANNRRRAISLEAAARGIHHNVVRSEWDEAGR